jgi:hypothetical protein
MSIDIDKNEEEHIMSEYDFNQDYLFDRNGNEVFVGSLVRFRVEAEIHVGEIIKVVNIGSQCLEIWGLATDKSSRNFFLRTLWEIERVPNYRSNAMEIRTDR